MLIDILEEIEMFHAVLRPQVIPFGGLYLETTPLAVTECVDEQRL